MSGRPFSDEQKKWIRENVSCGVFKDKKHFLAVFNAIFNDNRTFDSMVAYLRKHGLVLVTAHNKPKYTQEQDDWLKKNYCKYNTVADLLREYNGIFGTDVNYAKLASHCVVLGIHTYDAARRKQNAGNFKKGVKYGIEEAPVGTIRYNKQRNVCFVKVMTCDGKSRDTSGHNYKEPFWRVLQDKVWEDHYGKIPDGYMACPLNENPYEDDVEKIALIDKRGKAVMGRKRWWSDNVKFTATAVRWCNLYFIAKDRGIV